MYRDKNISFIVNPIAGGRKKSHFENLLKMYKEESGLNASIIYTRYAAHAYEIAIEEVKKGTDTIIAVGGDGTINEVARALIDTEVTLGVIPLGSGNGFARHFQYPLNEKKALKIILNNSSIKIDVGFVNDKPFFCTSGLGFDAETSYVFSQHSARGFFVYALSFFKVIRSFRPGKYKIKLDDKIIEKEAYIINVANISQFGYHFYISPEASASDGYLDLVIIRKFPRFRGIVLAIRSFFGSIHKSKFVEVYKVRVIDIFQPESKKIIHIDGDPEIGEDTLSYRIKERCLRVILP